MGLGGQQHTLVALLQGHFTRGQLGLRDGLDGCGKSRPNRDSNSDLPAHSFSLYRLSYQGPHQWRV